MSTLTVANITGQPTSNLGIVNATSVGVGANVVVNSTTFAVGANVYINSTAVFVGNATVNAVITSNNLTTNSVNVTALTVSTITANGTVGTANQVLTSNGSTSYWSTPVTAKNYALTGSMQKASFADATTYYFGSQPQATLVTTADVQRVYFPASGNVTAVYFSAYNNAGVAGTTETSAMYLRINNTTDYAVNTAFTLSMASNAASYFSNTAMNVAVNAGDYFEFKQVSATWATNPTNIQYGWTVYVT